ncbi:MAG TPA: hypothetical protein VGG48_04625 [Rhizomicrobium sp.]|jgi:hypothetical protein
MFYIRSMMEESPGTYPPEGFNAAKTPAGTGVPARTKTRKTQKRIRSVEPDEPQRGRGGQPGNKNARKTGLHTAKAKQLNAEVREVVRETRRVVAIAKLHLAMLRRKAP